MVQPRKITDTNKFELYKSNDLKKVDFKNENCIQMFFQKVMVS